MLFTRAVLRFCMARDPLDRLRTDLKDRGLDFDAFGTEADQDMTEEFLVGDLPESEVDEAASAAEALGFDDVDFEPSGPGRETVRFGRKRR